MVQGYVAKETVKRLLANYQGLVAGDLALDGFVSNSGPKAGDGVTGWRMYKIMIDEAVENLPNNLRACVVLRWMLGKSRGETLIALGISQTDYYKACDQAVEVIYRKMNGKAANYNNLLDKIRGQ